MTLAFYRIKMLAAVDLDEITEYREKEHDYLPADPTVWDTFDLARATCSGYVKKGDTRVLAIEPVDSENEAGSEVPQEGWGSGEVHGDRLLRQGQVQRYRSGPVG